MLRKFAAFLILLAGTTAAHAADRPQADLLTAFVDTLIEIQKIDDSAEADINSGKEAFSICIRRTRLASGELNGGVANLRLIKLSGDMEELPATVAQMFENMARLNDEMGEICSQLLGGSPSDTDHGKLAVKAAEISADFEANNKLIWEVTPLVVATIMDASEGGDGKPIRLLVTRAEREALSSRIEETFAPHMKGEKRPYIAGAAWFVRQSINEKGYICLDE
jgi:hypothetical protein